MLLIVKILGALGGLLVLIAGLVGAKPFLGLKLKKGDDLSTANITAVLGVLRSHLLLSLLLFAAGGACVFAAFLVFLSM
ncbi:MAG: hypothetical protein NOU37_06655 [Candidatus Brocadiales bacterium]|nr:hypothetical protein [Candidatus Bathyanammoxibius amoris]